MILTSAGDDRPSALPYVMLFPLYHYRRCIVFVVLTVLDVCHVKLDLLSLRSIWTTPSHKDGYNNVRIMLHWCHEISLIVEEIVSSFVKTGNLVER
jgi:hypothetical protein